MTQDVKGKMRVTLHIDFDPDFMISKEELESDFGGDWNEFIKYIFEEEGLGAFDNDIKFDMVELI